MTGPSANPPLMDKIELIERSLRVFAFGLPGIIPIFGTPLAIVALMNNIRIKRHAGPQWNPAQRYLVWGRVCARIGILITIIASASGLFTLAFALIY